MHGRYRFLQALTAAIGLGNFQSGRQPRPQRLLHDINIRTRVGHDIYAINLAYVVEGQLRGINVHKSNVAPEDHTGAGGPEETSHGELLSPSLRVAGARVTLIE